MRTFVNSLRRLLDMRNTQRSGGVDQATLGRRDLLTRSLTGGVALAVGGLVTAPVEAAADPAAESFRRVVVGNDVQNFFTR